MRQLVVVEVEMGQVGHPVPEHGRIDLGQAVPSKIENLQIRETGESVRRQFADSVASQVQALQRVLQTAPVF